MIDTIPKKLVKTLNQFMERHSIFPKDVLTDDPSLAEDLEKRVRSREMFGVYRDDEGWCCLE
jgi:hypothetical protein